MMESYKEEFIQFLVESKALQFGEFTLKSGRKSPYFINTGSFNDGASVTKLGYFYASRIEDGLAQQSTVIFGPSYKGIPLALSTVISLYQDFGVVKKYTFDRKEAKEHGDSSLFVGYPVQSGDQVLILDDVFTTGKTKVDTIHKLEAVGKVTITGVLIAVDRQEIGTTGKSAIKEFEQEFHIPVYSIVTVREIIEFLSSEDADDLQLTQQQKNAMEQYLKEYGIKV